MEEKKTKKTKKMTKAEAFEYLKGTRVYCGNCSREVQRKIFETDVEWLCGGTHLSEVPYLFVSIGGKLTLCSEGDFFKNHSYKELSVDDILSIEIVEEDEPLDKWEEFASKVAKIQETLEDDEVCIITKTNYLTMTK